MIADDLAQLLDDEGLVSFDTNGTGGNCFIDVMPERPDTAVAIRDTGGASVDQAHPYDRLTAKVWVRGPRADRSAATLVQDLYKALNGLATASLPSGRFLVSLEAIQSPAHLMVDDENRDLFVFNVRAQVRVPSQHRLGW